MAEEYVVLIVEPEWDPATITEEQWNQAMTEHGAFAAAVQAAGGSILGGDALGAQASAVRIHPAAGGKPAVFTDGPFADTKEIITGYYKLGVKDAAQARELAALCPTSGTIELWPVLKTGE